MRVGQTAVFGGTRSPPEDCAAGLIRHLVLIEEKTHEETSIEPKRVYPGVSSGLSTRSVSRSVCRFCASEGIQRMSRLTSDQLNRVVSGCVNELLQALNKYLQELAAQQFIK